MDNGKESFLKKTKEIFNNPINIDEKLIFDLPDLNKLIKYIETLGKIPNFDITKSYFDEVDDITLKVRECPDKCYFKKEGNSPRCYRYDLPNYTNNYDQPKDFNESYCSLIDKQKIYNEIQEKKNIDLNDADKFFLNKKYFPYTIEDYKSGKVDFNTIKKKYNENDELPTKLSKRLLGRFMAFKRKLKTIETELKKYKLTDSELKIIDVTKTLEDLERERIFKLFYPKN